MVLRMCFDRVSIGSLAAWMSICFDSMLSVYAVRSAFFVGVCVSGFSDVLSLSDFC